jgi:CheY-like chemotaxis protein
MHNSDPELHDFTKELTILYAEDDEIIRTTLQDVLGRICNNVIAVSNGQEGVEAFIKYRPDIIITDIGMPIMSGMEMLDAIKKVEPSILSMVATAYNDTAFFQESIKLSVNRYLLKPVRIHELKEAVYDLAFSLHSKQAIEKRDALIKESREFSHTIFNSVHDIVAIVDGESYETVDINKALLEYFDFDSKEYFLQEYQHIYQLFEKEEGFIDYIDFNDFQHNAHAKVIDKNHKEVIFNVAISEISYLGKTYFIVTLSDITALLKSHANEIELHNIKQNYLESQQKNAYLKEIKIIHDDLSFIHFDGYYCESFYKPTDTLSGDIYGTYRLQNGFLFYIADAMGKGVSASISSTITTVLFDTVIERANNVLKFPELLQEYIKQMQKYLFEEEILSVAFIFLDTHNDLFHYANYAMPDILIEQEQEVLSLSANNPPIMNFVGTTHINTLPLSPITKISLRSDGIDERELKHQKGIIKSLIEQFFHKALFHKDMLGEIEQNAAEQCDDATMITISRFDAIERQVHFSHPVNDDPIDALQFQIENEFETLGIDFATRVKMSLALNELLQNAYEHGSCGVTYETKSRLLKEGLFDEHLAQLAQRSTKKIDLRLTQYKQKSGMPPLISITITDEGEGFDVQSIMQQNLFKEELTYHGRGVMMAAQSSENLYYNAKGNEATLFLRGKIS